MIQGRDEVASGQFTCAPGLQANLDVTGPEGMHLEPAAHVRQPGSEVLMVRTCG